MSSVFTQDFWLLWASALAAVLWFPLRQLIWTISVRRLYKRKQILDEIISHQLKRRASYTSILIAIPFALLYTQYLFRQ